MIIKTKEMDVMIPFWFFSSSQYFEDLIKTSLGKTGVRNETRGKMMRRNRQYNAQYITKAD